MTSFSSNASNEKKKQRTDLNFEMNCMFAAT